MNITSPNLSNNPLKQALLPVYRWENGHRKVKQFTPPPISDGTRMYTVSSSLYWPSRIKSASFPLTYAITGTYMKSYFPWTFKISGGETALPFRLGNSVLFPSLLCKPSCRLIISNSLNKLKPFTFYLGFLLTGSTFALIAGTCWMEAKVLVFHICKW